MRILWAQTTWAPKWPSFNSHVALSRTSSASRRSAGAQESHGAPGVVAVSALLTGSGQDDHGQSRLQALHVVAVAPSAAGVAEHITLPDDQVHRSHRATVTMSQPPYKNGPRGTRGRR